MVCKQNRYTTTIMTARAARELCVCEIKWRWSIVSIWFLWWDHVHVCLAPHLVTRKLLDFLEIWPIYACILQIHFEQMDCLQSLDVLSKAAAGCTKLFVDLGGNRELDPLIEILNFAQKTIRPRTIVVKNEALYRYLPSRHVVVQVCIAWCTITGNEILISASSRTVQDNAYLVRVCVSVVQVGMLVSPTARCRLFIGTLFLSTAAHHIHPEQHSTLIFS